MIARGFTRADLPQALYASIWTVFLTIPVGMVWLSPPEVHTGWRILAYLAIVCLALVFVWCSTWFATAPDPTLIPRKQLLALVLLQVLLILLTIPAIGVGASSMVLYPVASIIFASPFKYSIWWILLTAAGVMAITVPALGDRWFYYGAGPLIGLLFIFVMRFVEHFEAKQREIIAREKANQEREAISRDIHDILGHTLTVLSLKAQLAKRSVQSDPERTAAELDSILVLTNRAITEVRDAVTNLRLPTLERQLSDSETALKHAGVTVSRKGSWDSWNGQQRAFTVWLLREATTNVIRHANASACVIRFSESGCSFSDNGSGGGSGPGDGSGFNSGGGFGLRGLKARAADAGYRLTITSDETGTTLRVEFR